jgi:hypothetical protein
MKLNVQSLLGCFVVLIACASCTQKIKALQQIDGKWQVTEAKYTTRVGQDSLAKPAHYFLTFNPCSNRENKTGCDLTVTANGKTYRFSYKIGSDNENQTFAVIASEGSDSSREYLEIAKHLSGTCTLVHRTDKALILLDQDAGINEVGITTYQIRQLSLTR